MKKHSQSLLIAGLLGVGIALLLFAVITVIEGIVHTPDFPPCGPTNDAATFQNFHDSYVCTQVKRYEWAKLPKGEPE